MRAPIVSDSVWIKSEGGTPWVVISTDGNKATIANAKEERSELLSNLKIVGVPDAAIEPSLGIPAEILEPAIAFARSNPKQVGLLDLHPKHESQFKESLAVADKVAAPKQQFKTGAMVEITEGFLVGKTGEILCYDSRSNCYVIRSKEVDRLLFIDANWVVSYA